MGRFRNRAAVALAGAILAGGLSAVAPAAPASANFNGTCGSGEVCLFYLENFSGPMADFYDAVADYSGWHFWNSSFWLNDNSMSVKNRANWSCAYIYRDSNYRGLASQLKSASDEASLYPYNNTASSHNFSSGCLFPYP